MNIFEQNRLELIISNYFLLDGKLVFLNIVCETYMDFENIKYAEAEKVCEHVSNARWKICDPLEAFSIM